MDIKKIQAALSAPFEPEDIEWRIQQAGIYPQAKGKSSGWALVLAYVTNRAIMERLDSVFGIDGWQNEYQSLNDGGIVCGIRCKLGDDWLVKFDGADKTSIEATKGGLSNSMKRAAVQWGIGRYLYQLESNFVNLVEDKNFGTESYYDKTTRKKYYWNPPALPAWALPKEKVNA